MTSRFPIKTVLILLFTIGILHAKASDVELIDDNRKKIALRNIGHEILTCIGDDTSRILPVEQIESQYILSFDTEFGFDPDDIVAIIRMVISESQVSLRYIVGVEQCATKELVYGFEIRSISNVPFIHCGGRIVPKDCYKLFFIFMDQAQNPPATASEFNLSAFNVALVVIPIIFLIGVTAFVKNRKNTQSYDSNLVIIGAFEFDKRNMKLSLNEESIDLSNKEAELLSLLHQSVNKPLKRALILQKVWENDSEYVGRTLDVFISKLRKKLEADPDIRIVNIRGIGYKLIVNPKK